MHVPFYGRNTGLKKGAVPVEHSDATSLNEEFNAETAPGCQISGTASGAMPAGCIRNAGLYVSLREPYDARRAGSCGVRAFPRSPAQKRTSCRAKSNGRNVRPVLCQSSKI